MKRNNLDICADILRISKNGIKKTHIVYKANLNFNIVKKYLLGLMESGFLEQKGTKFYLTDKGKLFIDRYNNLSSPFARETYQVFQ
jgi:predicted transcriptional regulator